MSKITKIVCMLSLLTLVSCNDFSFYDDSISESKEKGLFIDEYKPDKPELVVGDKKYRIIEAWTAYKFKSRGSKEIHKEIFAFTFILEDFKKKKEPDIELLGWIECANKDARLDKRVGIIDSQFRVTFDKSSLNQVDTIKFLIKNKAEAYDSINFIKK